MFALGIRYLNGWAMATHPTKREMPEWPPHPDRVFMALAAAHFETEGDENERHALEWLQSLPAPALAATEAYYRDIVTSYVPVNDTEISRPKKDSPTALAKRIGAFDSISTMKAAKDKGLALMPEHRSRQARPFPVAIPQPMDNVPGSDPLPAQVYLTWEKAEPSPDHQQALISLCTKVVSIGHSASLVQVWVEPSPPPANLVPFENAAGKHRLRVTSGGRLEHLESRFRAGLRPASSRWQSYAESHADVPAASNPQSIFDANILVLRKIAGQVLGLESTLQICQALRNTIMKTYPVQPPPEWVSGHERDGSPLRRPHLAFMPLPHVGHDHADGHLLGVAIAVPRDVPPEEQKDLGRVLFDKNGEPAQLNLVMGRTGAWTIELCDGDEPREALQASTWIGKRGTANATAAAKCWATVTPIVLDRYPKSPLEAEATVAASCQRIGLPRPNKVVVSSCSLFAGVPPAGRFAPIISKKNSSRYHVHAVLQFGETVTGPVLLGAGRYRGYGLCRPRNQGGEP